MKYILFCLLGLNARGLPLSGQYLEVSAGHRLWVEHHPATNGKPTLFLLNGLTYTTREWNAFSEALLKLDPELGLVRYDMEGMGRTMLAEGPVTWRVPLQKQIDDLKWLTSKLAIKGPISALGLSYGGAVAIEFLSQHHDVFAQVIAMSPYLESMPAQDLHIRQLMSYWKTFNPFDFRSEDVLYDWFLYHLVYQTYPLAEPIAAQYFPWKLEAIFRLAQGIRGWSASTRIPFLPKSRLHLIASRDDKYVTMDRMQLFFDALTAGIANSVAVWNNSGHKLVEERPQLAAAYIHQILRRNPDLERGLILAVDPKTARATAPGVSIALDGGPNCGSLLK